MANTTIQAELTPELTAHALSFVKEGWASDFDGLPKYALRRLLESHPARVTESMVMGDELRSGLAEGSLTFDQICGKFSDVFPAGDYDAVLFEFQPKLAGDPGAPDYFDIELREAWRGVEEEDQGSPLWPYYRTEPWTIEDGARCFEFIVPLYSPSDTDPKRVNEFH